jgi:two-component system, NarL family, nitrate/nitrite response regulator NarL
VAVSQNPHVAGRGGRHGHPRVLIADHHVPTRVGVRLALEHDGFVIAAEEATAPGAVAAALRDPPDLCLLDVEIPGGGIEAADAITAQLPQTQVVMLGEGERDEDVFAALEAGASGYLLREMDATRLGSALRDVLSGGAALPRALTGRLIAEFRARSEQGTTLLARPGEHDLTRREWDVLDCLRDGLSTRRIAKQLFISQTTVRRHVSSILRKLDVSSREAAIGAAAQRSRNLNGE